MEFVTLTRKDPEFNQYLLGTISSDVRALPVETFASLGSERVTFQMRPIDDLKIPNWWRVYFAACRPELLILTLAPVGIMTLLHQSADFPWAQMLALFFLHVAAFLFNDYQDHVRGVDRLNRKRGSRVIQKGWVTAVALRRWAIVNLVMAALFGAPALWAGPQTLWLVALLAGVALVILASAFGLRYGLGDLAIFALFGPLLACGVSLSAFSGAGLRDLVLGSLIGASTLWVFHVRQFEHLFRSRPEMFHTGLGYWPFERARAFVVGEAIVLGILQITWGVILNMAGWGLALAAVAMIPLTLTSLRIARASSPLSSEFVGISRVALLSHLAWTLWWVVGLWGLWAFA